MIALRVAPASGKHALAAICAVVSALCMALIADQLHLSNSPPAREPTLDSRPAGERAVEAAQQRLQRAPGDARSLTLLASAYLVRVRETGDPGYLGRAGALLDRALAADPEEVDAVVAAGSLALSQHEFERALELGERALRLAPFRAAAQGVVTDALVELGRYEEAVRSAQRMVDLRPDQPSLSRVSYLRELHGDLAGATEAMRQAVAAGAPHSEATAWAEVQLGHLLFAQGNLPEAQRAYERAGQRIDGYVHALAGAARVRAATGDLGGAAQLLERAGEAMPLPEFVAALADAYARLGDTARFQQQYRFLTEIQKLLAANGVRTDADLLLFNADRDQDLESTHAAARGEFLRRPSIHTADALAWAEYRVGDLENALAHSQQALRLGSRDPLMLYRAGVIAHDSGQADRAYELLKASSDLNPTYSVLWSGDLARRLSDLSLMRRAE